MNPTGPNVWGPGQILAFSAIDGQTDCQHGLVAQTAHDNPCAIEILFPARALLVFDHTPPANTLLTGDTLQIQTSRGPVRAAFHDAHHLLIEGPCHIAHIDPGLKSAGAAPDKILIAPAAAFKPSLLQADIRLVIEQRLRWLNSQPIPPSIPDAARRTWLKCLSILKAHACSPEGRIEHPWTALSRRPGAQLQLQNSAFQALAWRHINPDIARNALLAVIDSQQPDGRIPGAAAPWAQPHHATHPPLLALIARAVHQTAPDKAWLKSIYPSLCRYVQWDLDNRDSDGVGLVEWSLESAPCSRAFECGADHSPRFEHPLQLDAPDFNALLASESMALSSIATDLNKKSESAAWLKTANRLRRLINQQLWNPSIGLYLDARAGSRQHSPVLSTAGFFPMLCNAPDPGQTDSLVAHLHNPGTFGTKVPVPAVSRLNTDESPASRWLSPTCVHTNWLIARGLERCDRPAEADWLRQLTCREIERHYLAQGSVFEGYDHLGELAPTQRPNSTETRPPQGTPRPIHDHTGAAALYIDLILTAQAPDEPARDSDEPPRRPGKPSARSRTVPPPPRSDPA